MSRPVKPRFVEKMPRVTYFKPSGIQARRLEEVVLTLDELEAIRLKDAEGLEQQACARRMGVAQSTFQRIITLARRKLAEAVVEGKALRIRGGSYTLGRAYYCNRCRHRWGRQRRQDETRIACPSCGDVIE